MTVQELIDKLKEIEDKELSVAYNDDSYGVQYPGSISIQRTGANKGYYGGVPKDCIMIE